MLEKSLNDVETKLFFSLTDEMKDNLSNFQGNTDILNISIDDAYETIKNILKTLSVTSVFGKDIDALLDDLKYTVMIYSCYYAMEYLYTIDNPRGVLLDGHFIQKFYHCDANIQRDILNNLKRNIKKFSEVTSFPDPGHINPYIGYQYEQSQPKNTHIYSGNILAYLQKRLRIKDRKKYIHTISPSVIFIALTTLGYLPNGGNTNKSKHNISPKTLKIIDTALHGGTILKDVSGISYKTNQKEFLLYDLPNLCVPEIINSALLDDIFKIERVNAALNCYNAYIQKEYKENLTKTNEYFAASICSLLMEIPLSILPTAQKIFFKFLTRQFEDDIWKSRKKYLEDFFLFTSFIFPATVGLFCHIIFNKFSFSDTNIRQRINDISFILECNKEKILCPNPIKRIWLDDKIIYTYQYIGEKYDHYKWLDDRHKLGVSNVIGIIMNETYNCVRKKTIIEENYSRTCEQLIKACNLLFNGKLILGLDKQPATPLEYTKKLTADFLNGIKDFTK